MYLDEAIEHAEEIGNSCGNPKCSYEHLQLAAWLTELKKSRIAIKEIKNDCIVNKTRGTGFVPSDMVLETIDRQLGEYMQQEDY